MAKMKSIVIFICTFCVCIIGMSTHASNVRRDRGIVCAKNDASCYYEASRTYSVKNQPEKALMMINKAVELKPNNVVYLKQRGIIANWLSDYATMQDSYARILTIQRNDHDALLGMARYYSETHQLNAAARWYRYYLDLYPKNPKPWIEYANVEGWRGNYRASLQALANYRLLFGETFDYLNTQSRILAWAERPTPSLAIVNPLLRRYHLNYDVNVTNAIALLHDKQPTKALQALDKVQKLRPDSQETKDVTAFVKTPLCSNINLGGNFTWDTDNIKILYLTLFGEGFFTPQTSLLYGVGRWNLVANKNSEFTTIDEKRRIYADHFWLGLRHRFNRHFMLEGTGGYTQTENHHNFTNYNFGADLRVSDAATWYLQHQYELYSVSPRAVSLGIRRRKTELRFNWEPYIQRYLTVIGSYSEFSDGNHMWSAYAKPSMGVVRSQYLNLDLGISASQFGFSKDLDNGYYDPKNAQYYAATADFYIKQSDNVGYAISLAAGAQKDSTYNRYRFGFDAALKAYFGIYKHWMLVIGAGVSNRESEVNAPTDNKNYRIGEVSAVLTHRFC